MSLIAGACRCEAMASRSSLVADHGFAVGPNFHAERRTDLDRPLQKLEQLEQAIEETVAEAIPPKSRWRVAARIVGWTLFIAYLLFAGAILALRYWILPKVSEYRSDIEQYAYRALGQRITIGAIDADWQGLRPELLLANVTVFDHDGRAALSLPAVEATLGWISAVIGSPRFHSLVFERPRLEIRRDERGRFYVAGIELHAEQAGDTGIARWVLSQREIVIRDASVSWDDKQRGAPLLELPGFNFVLRNGFLGHRFAFKAKPSAELASALDVRGDLDKLDAGDPGACVGQIYAELEYTDLVACRRRDRRRCDRARAARATRRIPAVSARHPCAPDRNRAARQRPRPEGRLDGRPGGSAALQPARRLREARRARPRQNSRIRGAH